MLIKTSHGYTNVDVHGSGNKTILFLHGWGGSTLSFFGAARHFSKDFKTINMDFYYHGRSSHPNNSLRLSDFAKQVKEVLVHLKEKEIYVCAHSFGCRVALLLASENRHIFSKIVLVAPAGLKPRRNVVYYYKIIKYKIFKWLARRGIISKDRLKNFGSDDYQALSGVTRQTFVNIVNFHLDKYVCNIKNQTLIISGDKDKQVPINDAKKLRKKIPNSAIIIFKDANHFCYLSYIAKFVKILEIFFQ